MTMASRRPKGGWCQDKHDATQEQARKRQPKRLLIGFVHAECLSQACWRSPGSWWGSTVNADQYGECYGTDASVGCEPDSVFTTWCWHSSLSDGQRPQVRDAWRYSANNLDGQTNIGVGERNPCNNPDIRYAHGPLGGSRGNARCLNPTNDTIYAVPTIRECKEWRLMMDGAQILNEGGPYQHNLNKTGCHETGHAVGYQHHLAPYGDCMVRGRVDSGHVQYDGHHVGHLNDLLRSKFNFP